MNDAALFEATVPLFQHYLRRINHLLSGLSEVQSLTLAQGLAPNAFTAGEHFHTAITFATRTVCPLLGKTEPDFERTAFDRDSLLKILLDVEQRVLKQDAADFEGASRRVIHHTAGEAELKQDATSYVTIFALPNFFFHLTSAFAILRQSGVEIGKADFDGLHRYSAGFHF